MNRKTSLYDFPDYKLYWNKTVDFPKWYINSINKLKGFCLSCGKELNDKRRKYCKPKSEDEISTCKDKCICAIHDLQVTSIRRFIHKLFDFTCQKCGKHFSYFTSAGAELPIHSGEVDHIISLYKGGEDKIQNMTLLCFDCHKDKTKKDRMLDKKQGVL